MHTLKTLLRDYLIKNAFYSTEDFFFFTGHDNWLAIGNLHLCSVDST